MELRATICGIPLGDGTEVTLGPGIYLLPPLVADLVTEVRSVDGSRLACRLEGSE